MVIRRKSIHEAGLLDERFFMYWEDADWCRQMREKGWKVVYYPSSSVSHVVGISSSTRPIRSIYHFHKSCYLLYDKYIHWPLSLSKPFAFLGLSLRFCVAAFFHLVNLQISRHPLFKSAVKRKKHNRTSKKIKVLRIITRLNIGGPAIHVNLLTKGLDIKKFESTLVIGKISPQEGDMTYLSEGYFKKPIIIPELQRKINIGNDLRSIVRILKIIQQEKPDIVHTHTAKAGSCARIASFLYNLFSRHKVKTIHTFHGHVFEGYFKKPVSRAFILIERLLSRFTDVIIAISNTQKHELSDKYRITPAHKIKTIQLGFHLNSFLESNRLEHPFRQRFGIDDNTFLIGIVGRLVPIKNHVMFLNVVKIFLQQNPDVNVKFMVIGDGELRSVLEEYCRKEGLSDHVRFCGWVIDVHSVYTDLDILALTSINEGTPVSVIEAMASSVPVIATDVGGIKDLLGPPDGLSTSNGFQTCERGSLCKKNDPESFARGLQYLMKNGAGKNSQRIVRAKDFVTRHYSNERLLREMESLYSDLLCETRER